VGTAVTTAANPAADSIVAATATCAVGKVALGGGGWITITASAQNNKVAMRSTYPSATNVWTVEAVVTGNITGSNTVTVTPYVLCSP
jgi:hypothetical protein